MKIKKTVFPENNFSKLEDGFQIWRKYISAMSRIISGEVKKMEAVEKSMKLLLN